MELEEKGAQKVDLFIFIDHFLKEAKRRFVLLIILVLVFAIALAGLGYTRYSPIYKASASFTVKVANPLYSGVSSYNSKTAEQMATTFPYILTSGVLQERVKAHLGIPYMPSVSVNANSSSSIITMTVTDSDPQRAYDVLNAVMTYYPEIAEFVVGSTVLVLLDESGVPTAPSNALDIKSSLLKGALMGFALWAAIVIFFAVSWNTIHNEEKLKKVINSPCIGQIPQAKITKRMRCPIIHTNHSHTGFSESVRLLRLHTEQIMTEQNKKVILISSAIPGEGKTTVSVNLSLSLAKKGSRVLLVDCDLRNPSVTKMLQLKCDYSLDNYLQGETEMENVINGTNVENLFVVSGGQSGSYFEKSSMMRMANLIEYAKKSFDVVILDTPPCSLLADASEISSLAECGIMVIRQDFASQEQILDGIQRLGDSGLPIVGCVLNGVKKSITAGYGYGYGYGSYGNYGEKKK